MPEEHNWIPLAMDGAEEEQARFAKEWSKMAGSLRLLHEQVKILTRLFPRVVEKVDEESLEVERSLVKLRLNVGSHTALQEKLGVSSVWQGLAHHDRATTKLVDGGGGAGNLTKLLKGEIGNLEGKLEELEKTMTKSLQTQKKTSCRLIGGTVSKY